MGRAMRVGVGVETEEGMGVQWGGRGQRGGLWRGGGAAAVVDFDGEVGESEGGIGGGMVKMMVKMNVARYL